MCCFTVFGDWVWFVRGGFSPRWTCRRQWNFFMAPEDIFLMWVGWSVVVQPPPPPPPGQSAVWPGWDTQKNKHRREVARRPHPRPLYSLTRPAWVHTHADAWSRVFRTLWTLTFDIHRSQMCAHGTSKTHQDCCGVNCGVLPGHQVSHGPVNIHQHQLPSEPADGGRGAVEEKNFKEEPPPPSPFHVV